jgi:hypothetical protein
MMNLAIEDGLNPDKSNTEGRRDGSTCRIYCVMLHVCRPPFELKPVPLLRPSRLFGRHLQGISNSTG